MRLEEIFATNPELQKEPEVQKLIEYVKDQHKRSYSINRQLKEFEVKVLDIAMHSELMLIDGTPAKEALDKILKEFEKGEG